MYGGELGAIYRMMKRKKAKLTGTQRIMIIKKSVWSDGVGKEKSEKDQEGEVDTEGNSRSHVTDVTVMK